MRIPLARSTALRVSRPLAEVGDLDSRALSSVQRDVAMSTGGREVGLGERLDDVGHHSRVAGALDQLLLAEGGQHDDRRDALLADLLGRADARRAPAS
jgi:hypothetical protein